MSKRADNTQYLRRNIIAECLVLDMTERQMREVVMQRLGLDSYSTGLVHRDKVAVLDEWNRKRDDDVTKAVNRELAEIGIVQRELWASWQRSKEDGVKKRKQIDNGIINKDGRVQGATSQKIAEDIVQYGDVRYLHEFNALSVERRKLLGLYKPEKRELSGGITFADAMMLAAVEERKAMAAGAQMQDVAADGKPIDWDAI